ncbi:MAG: hypothetical protein ACYS6W_13720, partial [Planctomycetota bacterium]
MKKQCTILMLGLLVAAVFTGILWAEREREEGEVRGTFLRHAEREVGERGYLAIVIKPVESDDHMTVLVPRKEDFLHAARMLQEGDKVEIVFVVEEGQRWLKRIEAERRRESIERRRVETERRREDIEERRDVRRPRREGDVEARERPRRDPERREADELQGVFRRLWARLDRMERELTQLIAVRLERMERELKELRAENARLRRQLQERRILLKREPAREVRERRAPEGRREAREREEVREEREKARRERAERREQAKLREQVERREQEEQRERKEIQEREE